MSSSIPRGLFFVGFLYFEC